MTGEADVGVNDVNMFTSRERYREPRQAAGAAVMRPHRDDLDPWLPRFLNPSTMHPLTEDTDRYVLPHLLEESLHTDANEIPEELPLPFDQLGPDDVGTCLHDVLTRLVERSAGTDSSVKSSSCSLSPT